MAVRVVKLEMAPCCNKNRPLLAVIFEDTLKVEKLVVSNVIDPFVRVKLLPTLNVVTVELFVSIDPEVSCNVGT